MLIKCRHITKNFHRFVTWFSHRLWSICRVLVGFVYFSLRSYNNRFLFIFCGFELFYQFFLYIWVFHLTNTNFHFPAYKYRYMSAQKGLHIQCSHSCQSEPRHDKTNKMSVRPAKIQISLGIRPVWSESLLCAQQIAKDPRFLPANSEDSD